MPCRQAIPATQGEVHATPEEDAEPGDGTQPGGGAGQFDGGLNLYPIPISHPATVVSDSSPTIRP